MSGTSYSGAASNCPDSQGHSAQPSDRGNEFDSRADSESMIQSFSSHVTDGVDGPQTETSLLFLPNQVFSKDHAPSQCSLVSFVGMPPELTPLKRIAYLTHLFKDDAGYVRVVGALLAFLVKNALLGSVRDSWQNQLFDQRNNDTIHISSISFRNYCDVLNMSMENLRALHIFSEEIHPVGRGGMRGKEGDSFFGLMTQHVKTKSAALLLRSWLTFPSTDRKVIESRQSLVKLFLDPANRPFTIAIQSSMSGIPSVRSITHRMRRSLHGLSEWKRLDKASKAFLTIIDAVKEKVIQDRQFGASEIVQGILQIDENAIREVVSLIYSAIDFKESLVLGRSVVAEGYNDEIDELKRQYSSMYEFFDQVGEQEVQALRANPECPPVRWVRVIYEMHIGFPIIHRLKRFRNTVSTFGNQSV